MRQTSAPILEPGRVLANTYRIVGFVGSGGMGEVYEATHDRLAGRYAVKLLLREIGTHEDVFRRFKQEADVTSRLRHPHIVQVIDFAQMDDGTPYMVMEFLEGHDLSVELAGLAHKGVRMAPARVADLVDQIATGLAAAHSENIIHRDLKPANVFLVPLRGSTRVIAKIVDFGISKVRAATTGFTQTSAVIGTPQYMSPEQARGQRDVDARTDQFALAGMAYEMLVGRPAFRGDSVAAVVYQLVHEPPPSFAARDLHLESPALEAVVNKGLAKAPEDRYDTITDFAQALLQAAHGATHAPAPAVLVDVGATRALPNVVAPATTPLPRASVGATTPFPAPAASTTFRHATGERAAVSASTSTHVDGRRARRVGLVAGTTALVAAGVIVGVAQLRRGAESTPTRPAPVVNADTKPSAPPPATAEPRVVTIDVSNPPPGLTVTVDGAPTTLPLHWRANKGQHNAVFTAPGYDPIERTVDGASDLTIALPFHKSAPMPAPTPVAPREESPAHRHRSAAGKHQPATKNVVTDI